MTAAQDTYDLMRQLGARGLSLSFEDVNTIRRAALTLHRWDELECGDGNDWASWVIVRDEASGQPYLETHPNTGPVRRKRIPDREAGALRRVAAICAANGAHFFHQSDPRGAALYISAEPMTASDYSGKGVAA